MASAMKTGSGVPLATEPMEAKLPKSRHRLTFVSHAGEDKSFARSLQDAIEEANVATFFDEDMAVGTLAGYEMAARAKTADQGVVVLSRPYLTKEWPMLELHLFLKNKVEIFPLFYGVNPDQLVHVLDIYDRQAGEDEPAFRSRMKRNPGEWRGLMKDIGGPDALGLPDPMFWREDVGKIVDMTGLRREYFKGDEADYVAAAAKMLSPPVLPASMPPLPDHFVDQTLVDDVVSDLLLRAFSAGLRGTVLVGIGGAGKSVTASAVVRDKRIRRHFAEGVLWSVQDHGEYNETRFLMKLDMLARQFEEVVLSRRHRQGRDSQYKLRPFKTISEAQGHFQMWQKMYGLRCLLVVDNTWHVEVLQTVCALGFQILATTRKETAIPATSGWLPVAVREMDDNSSLRVLQNCSGVSSAVPRELALEVVRACASLPLALAIAGSTLRGVENPASPDTWRTLYRKLKNRADRVHDEGGQWDSLKNVLAVSVNELGQARKGLFLMVAVLSKGVLVPAKMLQNLWGEVDSEGVRFFLDGLVNRCLLQRRVAGRYFVHDLLLDFAKVNIEAEEYKERKELAISCQTQCLGSLGVLRQYFTDQFSLQGLYSLIGLWQSLTELSGNEHLELDAYNASLGELSEDDEPAAVADICSKLGYMYQLQSKYDEARSVFERSLAIRERYHGHDHPCVADSLNDLGFILQKQAKYDGAEPLYRKSREIHEKTFGRDDFKYAINITNQAVVLQEQSKFAEAMPLLKRALAIWEKELGSKHHQVAVGLNNCGALLVAQGKYADAQPWFAKALAINESSLGIAHPNTITCRVWMAFMYKKQGLLDKAAPLYEGAISAREHILGPDHPDVAEALNNYALILQSQSKHEEADAMFQRSLSIRMNVFGALHPAVGKALNNQAQGLIAQGKFQEAEPTHERAMEIFVATLGSKHPMVATGLNNWAIILQNLGKHADADLKYLRAIEIGEEVLGPDHPDLALWISNRGCFLYKQNKYEEALPLFERTLSVRTKSFGWNHPLTVESRKDLANAQTKIASRERLGLLDFLRLSWHT